MPIIVAIMIVLVPFTVRVPAMLVIVPPLVMFAPAPLSCFVQLLTLVLSLRAAQSVMLYRLVQFMIRVCDAPLAMLDRIRPCSRNRRQQEQSERRRHSDQRSLDEAKVPRGREIHVKSPRSQISLPVQPQAAPHTKLPEIAVFARYGGFRTSLGTTRSRRLSSAIARMCTTGFPHRFSGFSTPLGRSRASGASFSSCLNTKLLWRARPERCNLSRTQASRLT